MTITLREYFRVQCGRRQWLKRQRKNVIFCQNIKRKVLQFINLSKLRGTKYLAVFFKEMEGYLKVIYRKTNKCNSLKKYQWQLWFNIVPFHSSLPNWLYMSVIIKHSTSYLYLIKKVTFSLILWARQSWIFSLFLLVCFFVTVA